MMLTKTNRIVRRGDRHNTPRRLDTRTTGSEYNPQVRAVMGARLRSIREERSLSQAEVSFTLGITQTRLSGLERGRPVMLNMAERVARFYGTRLADLVEVPTSTRSVSVVRFEEPTEDEQRLLSAFRLMTTIEQQALLVLSEVLTIGRGESQKEEVAS